MRWGTFSSAPASQAPGTNGPQFLRTETSIRTGQMPGFFGKFAHILLAVLFGV